MPPAGSATPPARWRRERSRSRIDRDPTLAPATTRPAFASASGTPSCSPSGWRRRSRPASPALTGEYADWTSPVYRRKRVPARRPDQPVRGPSSGPAAPLAPRETADRRGGPRRGHRGLPLASPAGRRRAQEERVPAVHLQGRLSVTIKWVQQDPLVHERRAVLLRLAADRPPAPRAARERLRPDPHPDRPPGAADRRRRGRLRVRQRRTASATPTSSRPTARWSGPATARRRPPACRPSTGSPGIVVKSA